MKKLLCLYLLAISPIALTTELKSPEAKALASELKQTINTTIGKIAELEKNASRGQGINLYLQQDSKAIYPLGLVLSADKKVLLVSPLSQADILGVKSGDELISLKLDDKLKDLSQPLTLRNDQQIAIELKRDEKLIVLNGSIITNDSIGWKLETELAIEQHHDDEKVYDEGTCGRVSIFFRPPLYKDIFSADIRRINDKPVMRGREVFKLAPGRYIIAMHEYIPLKEIGLRKRSMYRSKDLEVSIEPGKTYHLGAKFIRSKKFRHKNEEYWEPTVWKVSDRECGL